MPKRKVAFAVGDATNVSTGHAFYVRNATATDDLAMVITNTSSVNISGNLAVDTNTLYVDAANNRVGVGTASPAAPLDVTGVYNGLQARFGNIASRGLEISTASDGGTNEAYSVLNARGSGSGQMIFQIESSEKVRIDNSGNLGIGTTSPSYAVDIRNAASTALRVGSSSNAFGSLLSWDNPSGEARLWSIGAYSLVLGTNGTERMRLDASGNLGIGTASPSEVLAVAGNATANAYKLRANTSAPASTDAFIYRPADNTLAFGTASAEKMRLDASGRLGIGTTNPGYPLEVNGAARLGGVQLSSFAPGSSGTSIEAGWDGTQGVIQVYNRTTPGFQPLWYDASYHRWNISGNEKMRLDASGNLAVDTNTLYVDATNNRVGIGTASPVVALDVAGSTARIGSGVSTNDASLGIGENRSDSGYAYIDLVGDTTYVDYGLRIIRGNTGANAFSYLQHRGTGELGILTSEAAPITFYTTGTEKMRLDASGNLGLGTSTPSTYASGFLTLSKATASGDTAMTIRNAAAPVGGGVQGTILNFINDSGSNTALAYIQSRSNDGGTSGETSLSFGTYNGSALATRMKLDASGNLGIGTTTPAYLGNPTDIAQISVNRVPSSGTIINTGRSAAFIDLNGASGGSFIRFATASANNTSPNEAVRITSAGRVGINLTNPGSELDVNGEIRAGGGIDHVQLGATGVNAYLAASGTQGMSLETNGNTRIEISSTGTVAVGPSSVATNATDGFLYVPTCAGTPTGTPTTYGSRAAIVIDRTNNKLYFYSGGAWRDAGP